MSDEFVTLATFGDPVEAEMMKNVLAAEGIPTFVQGEVSGGLFSGMGGAFGAVRLLVAEENLERAQRVLDQQPEDEAEPETASHTGIKSPDWQREAAKRDTSPGVRKPADEVTAPDPTAAPEPPGRALDDADDEDEEDDLNVTLGPDDYASRAWRAAVLGLLMCPPVLHIYSVWLLLHLPIADQPLSPVGVRKVCGAVLIDALVFFGILFFMAEGFRYY